jgi:hypothetical protein
MKRIIKNELYANLYLKQVESSMDAADIAFLCMIAKINDIKGRR